MKLDKLDISYMDEKTFQFYNIQFYFQCLFSMIVKIYNYLSYLIYIFLNDSKSIRSFKTNKANRNTILRYKI